jgi:hypothetical protein
MKKFYILFAFVAISMLSMAQLNQLVWANGRLLYGTPIESMDSLTYDEMQDIDTLHLLLPRLMIKEVHDTVYIHDTIYVNIADSTVVPNPNEPEEPITTPYEGIGTFRTSVNTKVTFAPGNLQYHAVKDEWRFAAHQSDTIGITNENIEPDYDGWIDLFGWGTGDNPTNRSTNYYTYESYVDWGKNTIGVDAPYTWRALSYSEWDYIFRGRANAAQLFAQGTVNGVFGTIILPDEWILPRGVTFVDASTASFSSNYYNKVPVSNTYTLEEWAIMEKAGAVFLPAAGYRNGWNVYSTTTYGRYWSCTRENSYSGSGRLVNFYSGYLYVTSVADLSTGCSVRLVKTVQ